MRTYRDDEREKKKIDCMNCSKCKEEPDGEYWCSIFDVFLTQEEIENGQLACNPIWQ